MSGSKTDREPTVPPARRLQCAGIVKADAKPEMRVDRVMLGCTVWRGIGFIQTKGIDPKLSITKCIEAFRF